MNNFIEDYPGNKSRTLEAAKTEADTRRWFDEVDEEAIYSQLASPEFALYMEMLFSDAPEDSSNVYAYN
jgi:hypothetical protein